MLSGQISAISIIMVGTSYIQWDDDEFHFVLDQHAELDFYSASSLKQQSAGRHVAPLGHIILIEPPVFALSYNKVLGKWICFYLYCYKDLKSQV
jgi:hypothetical protein